MMSINLETLVAALSPVGLENAEDENVEALRTVLVERVTS
jgi:hypothetical protein